MVKFKLKIIAPNNIKVFRNGEEEAEGEDYKECLAYIAQEIVDNDIDDYEIILFEKGFTEKLKDFDPKAILKNSKKVKINDDDDDSDKDSRVRNSSRNREENTPQRRFVYTPTNNIKTYEGIGLRFGDVISKLGEK